MPTQLKQLTTAQLTAAYLRRTARDLILKAEELEALAPYVAKAPCEYPFGKKPKGKDRPQ